MSSNVRSPDKRNALLTAHPDVIISSLLDVVTALPGDQSNIRAAKPVIKKPWR